MTSVLWHQATPIGQSTSPPSIDTVRALRHDLPSNVDVAELASRCVVRARPTAPCRVAFLGTDRTLAVAAPLALSRAVNCVLDNAVRAAGPGRQVNVEVTGTDTEITIRVIDDGPGLAKVSSNSSLGLTITRALVAACGGAFELRPGTESGMAARIALPTVRTGEMAP